MSQIDPESGPNHKMRGENKGAEQTYNKCFGMSPEYEGKDHPCIFPFIYRGIVSDTQIYLSEISKSCQNLSKTIQNYIENCKFHFTHVANPVYVL